MEWWNLNLVKYFDTEEEVDRLEAEAASWLGTPYRHWAGVKGRAADCIHFVIKTFDAVGAMQGRKVPIPNYARDWHMHNGKELLRKGIEKYFPVAKVVDPSTKDGYVFGRRVTGQFILEDGDLILYKYGQHASHSAIYIRGRVYQALIQGGVHAIDANDPNFIKRLCYVYRFKKLGVKNV